MFSLYAALALAAFPASSQTDRSAIFEVTVPEKASGFATMAECDQALGQAPKARGGDREPVRGTAFNRAAGNLSRCEMIDGEPLIVSYPRAASDGRR